MTHRFSGVIPILSGLPAPQKSMPYTADQMYKYERKWASEAHSQFFEEVKREPTTGIYPVPAIVNVKATVSLMQKPYQNKMLKKAAQSPLTSYTGFPLQNKMNKARRNAKGYIPRYSIYSSVADAQRYGPVSTFMRGSGIGTDKWGFELPFMKRKQEEQAPIKGPYSKDGLMKITQQNIPGILSNMRVYAVNNH